MDIMSQSVNQELIEFLDNSPTCFQAVENFRKMQVAADYLLSLINDILQMSKIEDGNVPLTQEIINFEELSQDVLTIIEQRAKDREIQMQFRAKKEGLRYPFIYGSPVHLRQIFLNIYGKCIK